MSKNALLYFKYGIAKLYLIFPIVRIFQITRKLVHNDVFVNADVIEQNSKKLYAIIIEVYSLIKKTCVTFKLKNK
jgi:hypothetical protein